MAKRERKTAGNLTITVVVVGVAPFLLEILPVVLEMLVIVVVRLWIVVLSILVIPLIIELLLTTRTALAAHKIRVARLLLLKTVPRKVLLLLVVVLAKIVFSKLIEILGWGLEVRLHLLEVLVLRSLLVGVKVAVWIVIQLLVWKVLIFG